MASLDRTLRRQLESAVKQARRVAEAGERTAIESLAVQHHEPHGSMSKPQRDLRNRLRAHGRQLGDQRDDRRGTQTIDRLLGECAYEHWHRMLFARFLAENNLLIEPEHQLAISLADCQELARDKRVDWLELASSYAVRMLPQIFRPDDPVLEVQLSPETRSKLEDLLKGLPREVFLADDSLGWVYQFWQAEAKDAVNESEKKIGADELPAVTQLFTEDYMVEFLLHNTLGAWSAGRVLASKPELAANAKDETALRAACAIGSLQWDYLRFIRDGEDGPWRPAAGTYPHWPKVAKELRVLDPCCGSGHFLVFALPILARLRMEEEGLSAAEACDAVLRENLFGLELDPRCTQIAAFNLALAAWKFEGTGHRALPGMNVACSGLSVGASKEAWLKLAKGSPKVEGALARLYDIFRQAPLLGSLIDPRAGEAENALIHASFDEARPVLDKALAAVGGSDEEHEAGVAALGLMDAVALLARTYTLVITNVPYLARGKQDPKLREFAEKHYAEAKQDLATVFVRRCLDFTDGGTVAAVTPQNWLFLTSYKKLRENLLRESEFDVVVRLGPGAFETISGEVVNVALYIVSAVPPAPDHEFVGLDASEPRSAAEKAGLVEQTATATLMQSDQLKNPDFIITFSVVTESTRLRSAAMCNQGVFTGDANRFIARFWEPRVPNSATWALYQMAPEQTAWISGCHSALKWEEGRGALASSSQARICGDPAWGKSGVAVAVTSDLYRSLYLGGFFDGTLGAITPSIATNLEPVAAYVLSENFTTDVRSVDQALSVTERAFLKVPFDLENWRNLAAEKFPDGLPEPYSDDPTQWLFHGRPEVSTVPLQVAVARLVGYRWPAEHDAEMRLSAEARALVTRCADLDRFADPDGIVCLNPVHGEAPASSRLIDLLAAAYGKDWSASKLAELLAAADAEGKTLDLWLRDFFFEQHCAVFHNRPFVWHIWDGRLDGFHAFVNYHRLAGPNGEGARTLDKLRYTYLGDWIAQQQRDQKNEVEGADARLAAAQHLQKELEKIAVGEPPYDLFVRWKPLHEQAIGWTPDINDGVRLNIRPFMTSRPLGAKARNACILRATPKSIKWDKDRGKEPNRPKEDYPWFWGWDGATQDFAGKSGMTEPNGNRWNDLHYTRAFKEAARERRKKS